MKTNHTWSLNRATRIPLLVALAACVTRMACGTVVMIDFESITPGDQNSTFLQGYGISSVTTGGGGLPTRVYADQPEAVLPSGTHFFTPSGGGYPNPAFSSAPDYLAIQTFPCDAE